MYCLGYKDILDRQRDKLRGELQWWPNFLYHFTDVQNASSILYSGWIYSREQAEAKKIMANDNASRAVIDATVVEHQCFGRLYFRPLTPTQYHNEGYKPIAVRKSDLNASCPVPIFFCMSAAATLNYPGTQFAERGIAGSRESVKQGVIEFDKLNFDKIYHDGWIDDTNRDIIEYRHSEVIREQGFPVEPLLRCILCRSVAERETLLFLLKQYSVRLYNTYKDKIYFKPTLKCFYHNGIYVKNVMIRDGRLEIQFNDPELRMVKNDINTVAVNMHLEIAYRLNDGRVLRADNVAVVLNYMNIRSCIIPLSGAEGCDIVRVKIFFDDEVVYLNEISSNNLLF